MKTRIALSMAPILMFALGQQAHAATPLQRPEHHQAGRLAASRHGKTRLAALGGRHSRHVSFRHLAIRHVDGRHVFATSRVETSRARSYGVAETDGWNPAEAGISPPPAGPMGATLSEASFEPAALPAPAAADSQTGIASYYGGRHNGRRTSSGTIFNEHAMTAAHATLPFGTKVLVRVKGTDRAIVVTITDRLYCPHRIIDLSEGAAQKLGIVHEGLAMVMLTPEN